MDEEKAPEKTEEPSSKDKEEAASGAMEVDVPKAEEPKTAPEPAHEPKPDVKMADAQVRQLV